MIERKTKMFFMLLKIHTMANLQSDYYLLTISKRFAYCLKKFHTQIIDFFLLLVYYICDFNMPP